MTERGQRRVPRQIGTQRRHRHQTPGHSVEVRALTSIGARARNDLMYYGAMTATALLGAAFLLLEIREFAGMVAQGDGPTRSAYLSSFFALVGCHGLHVTLGLLWLLTMMAQVFAKGYRADIMRRVLCFALFWHTLDIIWVGIFTVVYLMGLAI